jgi:hypothetical protein
MVGVVKRSFDGKNRKFEAATELEAKLEAARSVPTLVEAVTEQLTHELTEVTGKLPVDLASGARAAIVAELCENCRDPRAARLEFVAALTDGHRDAWVG